MRTDHEDFVARFFHERFNLELLKISETTVPTPDFEVCSGNARVAVLEVKALESTTLEVDAGTPHAGSIQQGMLSTDNCAGRVAKKIHEAVRQLKSSALPKILVLLNNGTEADEFDLQEALRGFLSYGDENVSALPPETRRRMADDRSQIDLYVWIDKGDHARVVTTTAAGRDLRSRYFQTTHFYRMARDPIDKSLSELAWKHIAAEEYGAAETAIRRRIAIADPEDYRLRWELFGLLASTLNSLARHAEATAMLRESLGCARKVGATYSGIQTSRYMLANQQLVHGDPADALAEATPIPDGQGHVECLLHSVVAQALWKLNRGSESRQAAQRAIAASPTEERRSELSIDLGHILGTEDL